MRLSGLTPLAFGVVMLGAMPTESIGWGGCSGAVEVIADPPKGTTGENAQPETPKEDLDIKQLVARLRASKAIGFFTKLALKSEIDDLLEKFRRYHSGTSDTPLERLREQFNLLLLKVLSLLQDSDAELFRALAGAREVLWSKLADPKAFAQL